MKLDFLQQKRIPRQLLHLFTRQLAILLESGLPLLRSLEILAEQESNRIFKKRLCSLIESIQCGNTFSESLAAYPDIFSSLYLNMVRAGEMSGKLGLALKSLMHSQEKMQKMRNKIISILLYPALLLVITVMMMFFLTLFIIPKFETVFLEALHEGTLPSLTQTILEVSRYGRDHRWIIGLFLCILFLAIKIALCSKTLRSSLDQRLLRLPLMGKLLKKHFIAQCFTTLGTLMLHRVPPLEALSITQKIPANLAIQAAIKMIYQSLQAGDSMIYPLQASNLFPPMVISMVAVGEETGQLPEMLLQVATLYEKEVDDRTAQFITLMEPCLILLLACFVGTIIIALFLPLTTLIDSIGN